MTQDMVLDMVLGWLPRKPQMVHFRGRSPQDCILGYFQPSLAGLVVRLHVPRTNVLGTLSRPSGTQFLNRTYLTAASSGERFRLHLFAL
jgi:hypothetical protein